MKVPDSVHTNKCFLEALSTIFFFIINWLRSVVYLKQEEETFCFDTNCLGQSYTQIFTNTKEKKTFNRPIDLTNTNQ